MLNVLSSQMNFTYTLYEVCDGSYGSEFGGQWTGVVGEVVHAHAHIGLANLGANYARSHAVFFPRVSTAFGGAGIILKRPQTNSPDNLAVYFLPFSVEVWLCLCVSVPVAALVMHLTTHLSPYLQVLRRRRQLVAHGTYQPSPPGLSSTQVSVENIPPRARDSYGGHNDHEGMAPTPRPPLRSLHQANLLAEGGTTGYKPRAERFEKAQASGTLNIKVTNEKKDAHRSFLKHLWFAATVLMQQGQAIVPETGPARVVFGTMWVEAVILYAAYTSNLVSFFTVTKLSLPVNNLEQLVRSDYKFGTRTGSVYMDNFKASESQVYQAAWAKLATFGETETMPTYEAAIHRTLHEPYAFIGDYVVLDYYQKKDCNLVLLKQQLFQSMSSFILPRHSPLLPAVNHYLSLMSESGILEKLRQRWWPATPRCLGDDTLTAYRSVGLWQVCPALFLMVIGVVIALLVCSLEHAAKRLFHSRQQHPRRC